MPSAAKWLLQVSLYGLFALGLGYFSAAPVYRHLDPALAIIKLSFSHATAPRQPCRKLSAEELAALAPNMRRPVDCPRARSELVIEMDLDGTALFTARVPPTGLARDGVATVYETFTVTPGRHTFDLRLRDTPRDAGFDYVARHTTEVTAGQSLAIDFAPSRDGFEFH